MRGKVSRVPLEPHGYELYIYIFCLGHTILLNIFPFRRLVCKDISNGQEDKCIPASNLYNPSEAPTGKLYGNIV